MAGTRYVRTEHGDANLSRPVSSQIRPTAKVATVPATATGVVYTLARLLGGTSQLALINGTNANLKLDAASGAISAASAIGDGVSQKALVRENDGEVAIEYPVTLTGLAAGVLPLPTPTVAISAAQSKNEGNSGTTSFVYTVTRSAAIGAVSVRWSFNANNTSASDFAGGAYPQGGSVDLADGVASGTFTVAVNGDTSVEPDESFEVSIVTPAGYAAGAAMTATGTILNDDVAPVLALSSAAPSITANAAAGTLVSNIANVPAGVTPSVTPGDGRLVIAGDGSTGWKVVVGLSAVSAGTINFAVAASGATSANGVLTVNAAPTMPTVSLSGAQSKSEGNSGATLFTYTVTRSATSGAANVAWTFAPGSTSADDFTGGSYPTGGTVALADGVASGTFSVSVNGDTTVEANETFTVTIAAPSGYAAGSTISATGTIVNDDAAAQQPYRLVSAGGKIPDGKQSVTGTVFTFQSRVAFGIGSGDALVIRPSFDAWCIVNLESATDGFTFSKVAIEMNGITVPVTFNGQRSVTLAAGDSMILGDELQPSQFGPLLVFPRDAICYVRAAGYGSAAGSSVPAGMFASAAGLRMERGSSTVTITDAQVDATGAMTSQGGTQVQQAVTATCLVGKFVNGDPVSVIGVGDSIMIGLADITSATLLGKSWLPRAAFDANGANLIAFMQAGHSGDANWMTSAGNTTRLRKYFGICNTLIDEFDTNDLGTSGGGDPEALYDKNLLLWNLAKAEGSIKNVYRTTLLPRTTSQNSGADVAGQTPNTGWGTGGNRDILNQKFRDAATAGMVKILDLLATVQADGDPTRWKAGYSVDGTHPYQAIGNVPLGIATRAALLS